MKPKRLLTIFLSVLSGVCFGVAISTLLLTNGYLTGSYRAYIVESGSMTPALPVGSVIFTKSTPKYQTGDIVTFSQNGKNFVTHRIVEEKENSFITKGDANEEADTGSVLSTQIVGKSILVVPYIGYLADFVKTPKGFVILVVIPAAIIVYEEIKSIFREIKKLVMRKKPESSKANAAVFLPIFGIALLFLSSTKAFSFDIETSKNILGTEKISTQTPEPTETPNE